MSVIKALHDISTDVALSFDEKVQRLLGLGTHILGLEWGIVSQITDNTYTVINAVTPDDVVNKNDVFALCDTYCADTFDSDGITAYHNISQFPGAAHPCFAHYPLRSYFATVLYVNGELFGTVSFSSIVARKTPFGDLEHDYLLLLAEWIGIEISRHHAFINTQRQQKKLSENNMLLRQITELAGVGTWELDLSTDRVTCAPSLKQILGFSQEQITRADDILAVIKDPSARKSYKTKFIEIIKTGEDWTHELEIVSATGETKWVETQAQPIYENGRATKVIGATQDITQRVFTTLSLQEKTRVAENALEARSLFLANMSHEIRTPIHGVQGMLEALSNTALDSQQQEFTDVAMRSTKTLEGIVNDILDFSKIDAGQMRYEEVSVDLAHVVQQQTALFRTQAEKKGLHFIVDTTKAENVHVLGDSLRFSQIIINLLNNAVKFTTTGTIKVSLKYKLYGEDKCQIKLIVSDTGIGISDAQQKVIFMPFLQAESSTSRQFGGTGLGLAIVAKIVEHYGGDLSVSSTLGEGSRFVISIVLKRLKESTNPTQSKNLKSYTEALLTKNLCSSKILVVEDNDTNQIVIREQLKELGVVADVASNGKEGVDMLKRSIASNTPYQLILMDCHMPVMDGISATKTIRALGGLGNTIPIVALTANVFDDERERCLKNGMNDFLSKPISTKTLGNCLRNYLLSV